MSPPDHIDHAEQIMYYGSDISASGILTAMHRLDALSNNMANIDTVGYKPVSAMTMSRDPARMEDNLGYLPSDDLMEKLGAGVIMAPSQVSFSQGAIEQTGNDFDIAIEGDGFLVARNASDGDQNGIGLTRDGRMALNSNGVLVQAASGRPILDTQNRIIRLRTDQTVEIDNWGMIRQDGSPVAQIRLVDVADRSQLEPQGDGLYKPSASAASNLMLGTGRFVHRAVEGSAVNEISALLQMQGASSAVRASIGLMTYQDRMAERAINTFGRIG
jgi:flagellar basal body rod protein FlgG